MNTNLLAAFTAPIITAIFTFLLNKLFYNCPRLIAYYGHISEFKIRNQDGTAHDVFTHTVVIRNIGKLTAKNVRLGHNILPLNYNIQPNVKHEISDKEIVIPKLVPKEQVTVSYLYFPPLTCGAINTYAKSDEGLVKVLNVIPAPNLSTWKKWIIYFLLFMGFSTIAYLLIILITSIWHLF